jgi:hypothetical protein
MAKRKVNKSEEVRQLIKANPKIKAKEAVAAMAEQGISMSDNMFYYVKGQMKGRKKKANKMVTNVVEATGNSRIDALATILKVKALANEVGGLKKLRALVEALSE